MARKNTWLPGQPGFGNARPSDEPDSRPTLWERPSWGGPSAVPLADLILGAAFVVIPAALAYFIFVVVGPPFNLVASLIVVVAILVMLGVAIWRFQHAIRRIRWRRKHIAQTGGRYLHAWERTPTSY